MSIRNARYNDKNIMKFKNGDLEEILLIHFSFGLNRIEMDALHENPYTFLQTE